MRLFGSPSDDAEVTHDNLDNLTADEADFVNELVKYLTTAPASETEVRRDATQHRPRVWKLAGRRAALEGWSYSDDHLAREAVFRRRVSV